MVIIQTYTRNLRGKSKPAPLMFCIMWLYVTLIWQYLYYLNYPRNIHNTDFGRAIYPSITMHMPLWHCIYIIMMMYIPFYLLCFCSHFSYVLIPTGLLDCLQCITPFIMGLNRVLLEELDEEVDITHTCNERVAAYLLDKGQNQGSCMISRSIEWACLKVVSFCQCNLISRLYNRKVHTCIQCSPF